MHIGTGFNTLENEPTNQVCLDDLSIASTIQQETSYTAFYQRQSMDLNTELELNAEGDFDFDVAGAEMSGAIDAAYDEANSQSRDSELLVIDYAVQTMTRYGSFEDGVTCDGFGMEDPTPSDFFGTCGDRWLSSETLGGHVFLFIDISQFSSENRTERRLEIESKLDIGIGSGEAGVESYLNHETQYQEEEVRIWLAAVGLPGPTEAGIEFDDQVEDGQGLLGPQKALDYIGWLNQRTLPTECETNNGRHPDGSHNSVCGAVIDQGFSSYNPDQWEVCMGPGSDWEHGGYDCAEDYMSDAYTDVRRIPLLIEWIETVTASPSNWAFPNGITASDLTAEKTALEKCMDEDPTNNTTGLFESIDDCYTNVIPNYTTAAEICDLCHPPPACAHHNVNEVSDLMDEVVPADHLNPETPELDVIEKGDHHRLFSVDDRVCVMTGFQGDFADSGQQLRLYLDGTSSNQNWKIQAYSNRDHLKGNIACAKRSKFVDTAASDPQFSFEQADVEAGDPDAQLLSGSYASAFAGITGNMRGGAEGAEITQVADASLDSTLAAQSQAGFLKAYGISFGADNPANGAAQFGDGDGGFDSYSVSSNGDNAEKMTLIDDSLCYLTQVEGEFDGHAESVRITAGTHHWRFKAKAACKDHSGFLGLGDGCDEYKTVRGQAHCYKYDQR